MTARLLRGCCVGAVTVALWAAPAAHAVYAGHVRSATSTVQYRGIDGHVFVFRFEVSSSGVGGTETFATLRLTLQECQRASCRPAQSYVRSLRGAEYSSSTDLSLTDVSVPLGGLRILLRWSAPAGFGAMPPAAAQGDSVASASSPAQATVLLGNDVKGGLTRFARCIDNRARVTSALTVSPGYAPPTESWPTSVPAGLAVKLRGQRYLQCV